MGMFFVAICTFVIGGIVIYSNRRQGELKRLVIKSVDISENSLDN